MAIQFACPACQQPIEVDDEWAGQTVSCPYCRRVIRAPERSTLEVGAAPAASQPEAGRPVATSAGGFGSTPPPPPPGYAPYGTMVPQSTGAAGRSAVGGWSLVCGVLAWGLMVAGIVIIMPVMKPIFQAGFELQREDPSLSSQEINRRIQQQFQETLLNDTGYQKRSLGAIVLIFAAEALAVTGLILGFIGATRARVGRGAAIMGAVVCSIFLVGQCGFFGLSFLAGG